MRLKRCDMDSFSELVVSKGIICYGIGREFERIISCYYDYDWVKRITMLVDGNPNLAGKLKKIGDKSYKISEVDELLHSNLQNSVILITTLAYSEIIEKLDSYKELLDVDAYIFYFMFGIPDSKHDFVGKKETEYIIPPIIHYCWFGNKKIPDTYKKYMETWSKFCPNYEIRKWDENNCNIDEVPYTKEAYSVCKYGFVPDYFRLKIIYEYGGIYLDTDVELLKSLDPLRCVPAFCGMQYPGEVAFGLGFGAVKGHPVIKAMLDSYIDRHFILENGEMDLTPSPIFQTNDFIKMGYCPKPYYQEKNGMAVYPVDVLSPKNVHTGELLISDRTVAVHHFDGSWIDSEKRRKREDRRLKAESIIMRMNY